MDDDFDFMAARDKWSYSKLTAFAACPHEWKRLYVDHAAAEGNFFAEFGSWCHRVLEGYCKKELTARQALSLYKREYDRHVTHDAPFNMWSDLAASYYSRGCEFFSSLDLGLRRSEVLGVERLVEFRLQRYPFVGFVDLILRDRKTGRITIVDHKSGGLKILRSGEVSKTDRARFLDYKRQLYLYSIPVIREFGPVSTLAWNLMKDRTTYRIAWRQDEYDATIAWALATIRRIRSAARFPRNRTNAFYCDNLCSQRNKGC